MCCPSCGVPSLRVVTSRTPTRGELLATAIKEAMDAAGINAEQLAPVMNESVRTIGRWRSGESVPDALQVVPLAEALGVDPMLFIKPPEPPPYPLAQYRTGQPMDAAALAAAAAAHGSADAREGAELPRLAALPGGAKPRTRPTRTPR